MKKLLLLVMICTFGLIIGAALANNKPSSPPGQDPCSHGRTGKECRPDPQPDRGKDCEKHGKKGGVNEDHCKGEETPPPPPPPTPPPPPSPPPASPPASPPPPSGSPTPPTTPTPVTTPVTTPSVSTPVTTPSTSKPDKPVAKPKAKAKAKKVKIVKVTKKKHGVVIIKTSDGKTHVGQMGAG